MKPDLEKLLPVLEAAHIDTWKRAEMGRFVCSLPEGSNVTIQPLTSGRNGGISVEIRYGSYTPTLGNNGKGFSDSEPLYLEGGTPECLQAQDFLDGLRERAKTHYSAVERDLRDSFQRDYSSWANANSAPPLVELIDVTNPDSMREGTVKGFSVLAKALDRTKPEQWTEKHHFASGDSYLFRFPFGGSVYIELTVNIGRIKVGVYTNPYRPLDMDGLKQVCIGNAIFTKEHYLHTSFMCLVTRITEEASKEDERKAESVRPDFFSRFDLERAHE